MSKKRVQGRKKIANEISTRILTAVITIFVVVAIIAVAMIGQISVASKKQDLTLESKAASYQLQYFFAKYLTTTKQMSLNPDIQGLLEETKAGDDIRKQELYQRVFDEMKQITGEDGENILACWVGDVDASILTQSDGYTSDGSFDITKREWYQTVETGKSMLTEPYVDASTGKLILSAASPIYDTKGEKIVGVAGVDISLEHMQELMAGYTIGKNGFVMLLTASGTMVYHPDESYRMKKLEEIDVSDDIRNALDAQQEKLFKYKVNGNNRRQGYLGKLGDQQYFVLSCMPYREYYGKLLQSLVVISVAAWGGMFLIIAAIRNTAKSITKPIEGLNAVAQELAEGNLDVEISIDAQNEIGELGESIQKTVNRLKAYIDYIDEISKVLTRLAEGKLKVELRYDYAGEFAKVKEAMLYISDSMKVIMENIINSSAQVSAGADDLSNAAQNIASAASGQAASVEELVATAISVSEQVTENTKVAKESAEETGKVTTMMENSREQLLQMREAMEKINETSRQMEGIIKTIEEIADQTNLLALNASIEAARAGEAGRGFAVVASEIGSLADESAKAANNTKELIEISMNEIAHGSELVSEVVASIQEVVTAVGGVDAMIGKTAENSMTQADNMEQIRMGIEEISKGVEDNSAAAEESSATSQQLAAQAATLSELVQKFELD